MKTRRKSQLCPLHAQGKDFSEKIEEQKVATIVSSPSHLDFLIATLCLKLKSLLYVGISKSLNTRKVDKSLVSKDRQLATKITYTKQN